MNILLILLGALMAFALAYRYYARWIGRVLRQSDAVPTPAMTQPDGRDFVAAPMPVLFSHHFATIAGDEEPAGPCWISAVAAAGASSLIPRMPRPGPTSR